MKNITSLITTIVAIMNMILASSGHGQSTTFSCEEYVTKNLPAAQVLTVGTFHFAYYNLDAHVTEQDQQKNILSPEVQKEMEELLDYIALFKPNKIVIEAGRNTGYLMNRFRKYQLGEHELLADEIEQIGFRLLDRFHLDTLYGCNDNTLVGSLWSHKDSLVLHPIFDSIFNEWDFTNDDEISRRYKLLYQAEDSLNLNYSLLEYFKYLNSKERLNLGFGAYLCGDFTNGTTEGADALALHWYSRNLRIFRHIQNITTSENDRILVLFGAGHIEILGHLFDCSPAYNRIDFNDLQNLK